MAEMLKGKAALASRHGIDASLGVGMVGGVKATFIALLAFSLCLPVFTGCQTPHPNGSQESPKTVTKKPEPPKPKKKTPPRDTNENKTIVVPVRIEDVVGEYEYIQFGDTHRMVFLSNGVLEWYINRGKFYVSKWKIHKDKEVHADNKGGIVNVFIRDAKGNLTLIALQQKDGKRQGRKHTIYKKIK